MIYGFISSLDDETTKVFFRSKKIRGNNIYNAGSLGELTSVLQSGDQQLPKSLTVWWRVSRKQRE